jgi:hypothetical protein
MGIHPQTAALMLKEHRYRPITGDLLTIGRQSVLLTQKAAERLIKAEGVALRPERQTEIDHSTVWGVPNTVNDRSFFSMFSDATVRALDASDYEGADIIHDLNKPLPTQHNDIADFIFNGSVLDDLFDPALAIRSLTAMLRPGGRIMHMESGSQHGGAFLAYSAEWFWDYYALNNFADCRVFLVAHQKHEFQKWTIWEWQPFFQEGDKGLHYSELRPNRTGEIRIAVIAEKGPHSTADRIPIRANYRRLHKDKTDQIYVDAFHAYSASPRRYQFNNSAGPSVKFRLLRAARMFVEGFGFQFINEGHGYKMRRASALARGMRRLGTIDFCD